VTHTVPAPACERFPQAKGHGKPDHVWEYLTPGGERYGYVLRWDATAEGAKEIRPCVYDGTRWRLDGFKVEPRPLYNAPALAARPLCPVLVVEGEKTADAARVYLPKGWEVTTWSGGTGQVKFPDWALLDGHPTVIWPDNDDVGVVCAATIRSILGESMIASSIVDLPPGLPPKWDLADPLPDDISADGIRAKLLKALNNITVGKPIPEPEPKPAAAPIVNGHHAAAESVGVDSDINIQPLGHLGGKFFFLSKQSRTIHAYTGRELQDKKTLRLLCTDEQYWYRQYGSSSENFQWDRAGADLVQQCYQMGSFDPDKQRGRGAWWDEGRVVFHAGNHLIVDGIRSEISSIKSRFFYPEAKRFFDVTGTSALSKEEVENLVSICRSVRWEGGNQLLGVLALGLIATATVCGVLRWRTHGWFTGASGSGKSWFLQEVVGRCLGDVAVWPLGDTTEPGIRRALGFDARPVVYDEAEAAGRYGQERRQAIITLMRGSSSEGRGEVMKAGMGDGVSKFRIRSQFMLASIASGLQETADENRCLVLTLGSQPSATTEQKKASSLHFAKLTEMVNKIPDDMPQRLMAHMLNRAHLLRQTVDLLAGVLNVKLGRGASQRIGDTLATPMAGFWCLTHDRPLEDAEEADMWLENFNWLAWKNGANFSEVREDLEIVRYITTRPVRVLLDTKQMGERTVGELMEAAAQLSSEVRVDRDEAENLLRRLGLRYDILDGRQGFYVANKHSQLDDLMRNSSYALGYGKILSRHELAQKSGTKTIRFGPVKTSAVWLPLNVWLATDEPELTDS
jgi:putative DNA primase/helicase